ncbi:hypothetical protein AB0395_34960 [Streptosporangium sp. NPDC051023]|uniref:hypothetical protein n=1 Tax=Streptosporangium sp. NPDC051023 TaxID=3155410 RepID=UPI003450019D
MTTVDTTPTSDDLRAVAAQAREDARRYTGLLRVLTGYAHNSEQPMTDVILGLAIRRAETHQHAAEYLAGYLAAAAAYRSAMEELINRREETLVTLRLYADGALHADAAA